MKKWFTLRNGQNLLSKRQDLTQRERKADAGRKPSIGRVEAVDENEKLMAEGKL